MLLGDGKGGFPTLTETGGPATWAPNLLDYDTDGDLDVIGITQIDAPYRRFLVTYTNHGSGRLSATHSVPLDVPWRDLRVVDLSGDGTLELVVLPEDLAVIRVYRLTELTAFNLLTEIRGSLSTPNSSTVPRMHFDVGDVDGDGLLDIAFTEDTQADPDHVWVATQLRRAPLEPPEFERAKPLLVLQAGGATTSGGALLVRDMNLDGKNDIVASSSAFEMWLLLQRSDGTFVSKSTKFPTAASVEAAAITVADFNCDGCPDAVGSQVSGVVIFPGVGCARD